MDVRPMMIMTILDISSLKLIMRIFWISRLSHPRSKLKSSSMALKWDQSERSQNFRYKVTAVFVRGLFSEGVAKGSRRQQMRCRLILLISEHPIQQGIRKGRRGRTERRILGSRFGAICNCPARQNCSTRQAFFHGSVNKYDFWTQVRRKKLLFTWVSCCRTKQSTGRRGERGGKKIRG